ncbi:MAG TPA: hypothetical protein VGL56_00845 [Fimbriimonadaceae bacterium]|jgi:hypothetical protein
MIATCLWFGIAFSVVARLRWHTFEPRKKYLFLIGPAGYLLMALSLVIIFESEPLFLINWYVILLITGIGAPIAVAGGFQLSKASAWLERKLKAKKNKVANGGSPA